MIEQCIFTLDTGRLFQETYDVFIKQKYGIAIKTYFPETSAVEELLNKKRAE
jgi:phosphoadenosine phosphosulfate reductase